MLPPLRAAAARSAARRLPLGHAARVLSPAAPTAGPSRRTGEYLARSRQPLARSLHSTAPALKDKRWVNSTKEDKDAEEAKEEDDEKDSGKSAPKNEVESESEPKSKPEAKAEGVAAASSSKPAPLSSGSAGSGAGSKSSKEIAKPSIPEIYPQVLALPITRRPLFPGFYKAVTITSPAVIKAIRELIAHGQPYIGAFLLKDSESDSDVITSVDQVHPVGVFAQITSVFSSADQNRQPDSEGAHDADKPETLTAVLYPHRRIHIDDLVKPSAAPGVPEAAEAKVEGGAAEQSPTSEAEANVASFEKEVPSVEETKEALDAPSESAEETAAPQSQIGFLHPLVPEISLTDVSNLNLEPFKKDSQIVRAIMGEILAVFKEIAQLQPIFREQSEWQCEQPNPSRQLYHVQLCGQRVRRA